MLLKHEEKINKLIPDAEKWANEQCPDGRYRKKGEIAAKWSVEFHRRMEYLTKKAGLRV